MASIVVIETVTSTNLCHMLAIVPYNTFHHPCHRDVALINIVRLCYEQPILHREVL